MARGKERISTTVLIIIVLAVIVAGGGGLAFVLFSAELPGLISEIGEEQAAARREAQLKYEQALDTANPQLCSQVMDVPLRDDCYRKLAIELGEPEVCGGIEDTVIRDFCLRNTRQCEGIESPIERDSCYNDYALSSLDEGACGMISDSSLRMSCYQELAIEKTDPSICGNLGAEFETTCVFIMANKTGNASHCSAIEDAEAMEACEMEVSG